MGVERLAYRDLVYRRILNGAGSIMGDTDVGT
jgi:hypothetical protein